MLGAEKIIAAANMDTLIVLPKRLGVETRISWGVESHPFSSSTRLWFLAKAPGPSRLKKMRAHDFRYSS